MPNLKTLNSAIKGTRLLLLFDDQEKANHYEAQSESDPALQRLEVYGTKSSLEGAKFCRDYKIDFAIVCQTSDFESFYLEILDLVAARPNLLVMALVRDLNFETGSRLKGNQSILDFKPISKLNTYEGFREIAFSCIRTGNQLSLNDTSNELTKTIQSALLVGHEEWATLKATSKVILGHLLPKYDFSNKEIYEISLAETIYFPWITSDQYSSLSAEFKSETIKKILNSTSSWIVKGPPPSTPDGFAITLANYLAFQFAHNVSNEDLLLVISQRPSYLKHQAIRNVSPQDILNVRLVVESNTKRKLA